MTGDKKCGLSLIVLVINPLIAPQIYMILNVRQEMFTRRVWRERNCWQVKVSSVKTAGYIKRWSSKFQDFFRTIWRHNQVTHAEIHDLFLNLTEWFLRLNQPEHKQPSVIRRMFVLIVRCSSPQMKETFARSSVSCLTGADLQSVTAVRGDPCWQVTQQLHLLIEKVTKNSLNSELCNDFTSLHHRMNVTYQHVLIGTNDSMICWPAAHIFGVQSSVFFLWSAPNNEKKTPHPLEFGDVTNLPTLQLQTAKKANVTAALLLLYISSLLFL